MALSKIAASIHSLPIKTSVQLEHKYAYIVLYILWFLHEKILFLLYNSKPFRRINSPTHWWYKRMILCFYFIGWKICKILNYGEKKVKYL